MSAGYTTDSYTSFVTLIDKAGTNTAPNGYWYGIEAFGTIGIVTFANGQTIDLTDKTLPEGTRISGAIVSVVLVTGFVFGLNG